jgi:putative ribosome biogenesis GTPase RsgA
VINNQKVERSRLEEFSVNELINDILALSEIIDKESNEEELLRELIADVNYALLVSKQDILNGEQAISLLAKSEQSATSMKDKDIVAFYGNSGAGKSTSVNFFLRVPLKKTINKYGDVIITIHSE